MSSSERGTKESELISALVRLGRPKYDATTVCEAAGVDREVGDRLWRGLGFPDVPEGVLLYTDADARALRLAAQGLSDLGEPERDQALDLILQEARIISAHFAAVCDAELDALAGLAELGVRRELQEEALREGIENSQLGWLIFYVLRRELDEAVRRRSSLNATGNVARERLSVAFVDLSGFTAASEERGVHELGQMLAEFEALVFDVVAEADARVVKLLGDEAMFVGPEPGAMVHAALEIIDRAGRTLLPAHGGMAHGNLLRRGGDYFGRAVNIASRINRIAAAGELLVDTPTRSLLPDDLGIATQSFGEFELKGLGADVLWLVRAVCQEHPGSP